MSQIEIPTRKTLLDNDSIITPVSIEPTKEAPRKTNPIPINSVNKELSNIEETKEIDYEDSDDDMMRSEQTPTIKIQSVESIQSFIGEEIKESIADNSPEGATPKSPTSDASFSTLGAGQHP